MARAMAANAGAVLGDGEEEAEEAEAAQWIIMNPQSESKFHSEPEKKSIAAMHEETREVFQ